MKITIFLIFTLLILTACGKYKAPVETQLNADALKYNDDHGQYNIQLTEENHGQGWKESECYMCHISDGIHNDPIFMDYQEITTCKDCHGTNGL